MPGSHLHRVRPPSALFVRRARDRARALFASCIPHVSIIVPHPTWHTSDAFVVSIFSTHFSRPLATSDGFNNCPDSIQSFDGGLELAEALANQSVERPIASRLRVSMTAPQQPVVDHER